MVWRPEKHLIFLNKVHFNLSDWALENNSVSLSQAAVFCDSSGSVHIYLSNLKLDILRSGVQPRQAASTLT